MNKKFVTCSDPEVAKELSKKLILISSSNNKYVYLYTPAIFEVDEEVRSKIAYTDILTF